MMNSHWWIAVMIVYNSHWWIAVMIVYNSHWWIAVMIVYNSHWWIAVMIVYDELTLVDSCDDSLWTFSCSSLSSLRSRCISAFTFSSVRVVVSSVNSWIVNKFNKLRAKNLLSSFFIFLISMNKMCKNRLVLHVFFFLIQFVQSLIECMYSCTAVETIQLS